jgi:hypothetical protein
LHYYVGWYFWLNGSGNKGVIGAMNGPQEADESFQAHPVNESLRAFGNKTFL